MTLPWRQASSLILLARKQAVDLSNKSRFDYTTLLLKRSPTMRFAPNASVFPGGQLDRSDLSGEWANYLSSSISLDRFRKKTADIYADIDHPYPGLVFRLCAIRETFEETGLLLAKTRSSLSLQSSPIFELSKSETDEWRKKIRDDASQFFQLCKQIDVEPDVAALTEWCEYLAPAFATTRFDTIFYTVTLPTALSCSIAADDDETISADWFEPDVVMRAYYQKKVDFLPPQVYELSRFARFPKLSNLVEFLSRRQQSSDFRINRMMSICYILPEATLLLMPGDDHYPADATFQTPILNADQSLKEFDSPNKNRLVMLNVSGKRQWQVQYQRVSTENSSEIRPEISGWELLSKI